MWTPPLACSYDPGVTHRPRGQFCLDAQPGACHCSNEFFVFQGNYERRVTLCTTPGNPSWWDNVSPCEQADEKQLPQDRSTSLLACSINFTIQQCLLSQKLVYNGGFQTLNWNYSFRIQPMWPEFCVALVTGCDLIHYKIWNHWAIYSYFGYVCHFTPIYIAILWHHQRLVYNRFQKSREK